MSLHSSQSWRHGQRLSGRSFRGRTDARCLSRFFPVRGWGRSIVAFLDRGESECKPGSRVRLIAGGIFLLACGVVYRLYDLQEKEFPRWSEIASKQHLSSVKVHGARGTIYDSQGRVLAVSIKSLSIAAHPHKVKDPKGVSRELGSLLPIGEKEVFKRLTSGKKFVWLSHGVPIAVEPAVRDLLTNGISAAEEFTRIYPQGTIAGQILGRVGRDGSGLSGLERQFNTVLAADDTRVPVRRDARGKLLNAVNLVSDAEADEDLADALGDADPVRDEGSSIKMSIDSLVQGIVEEELRTGAKDSAAKRAFALVMDAENGEILALAQSDEYDPNGVNGVDPEQMRNAVLQDAFEPGSTIKPLVAAIALDRKLVREGERMNCESSGRYRVGKHFIRDVHPVGEATFSDVLVRSSNICMAKLGQRLGKGALSAALRNYGFGATTGVELPGEAKGILRAQDKWAEVDIATHAFGQGVSVTALQLVQAYSALANDGMMVVPTLIKRPASGAVPRTRLLSEQTARTVADILRGVTESEHGTGLKAAIPGVHVSGKTGTAQKARAGGRGYDPNRILGSFIGFVDGREKGVNRKLIMFVGVDEPKVTPRWGGVVAGPIFQRAMDRILAHLMTNPREA